MISKLKGWLRDESRKLAPMTGRQRLEYIWMYYRWGILVAVAVVIMLCSLISNYRENSKEVLISGCFLNTSTSAEGYAHLSSEYLQFCGGDEAGRVELVEGSTVNFASGDYANQTLLILDAKIAAQDLDYLILDEESVRFFDGQELAMDLSVLLPEEMLDGRNTIQTETGTIAMDLTGTAFEKTYGLQSQPSYLLVIANTPHPEKVVDFIRYLL